MVLHLRAGKRSCACCSMGSGQNNLAAILANSTMLHPDMRPAVHLQPLNDVEAAARSVLAAPGYVVGSPFLMLGNIAQASSQREQ